MKRPSTRRRRRAEPEPARPAAVLAAPRALESWKLLAAALVLSAAVLFVFRYTYWRPFDDAPQDSTVSFHAYGFAAANGAGLWPNPVVAREIDLRESCVRAYPHWPNGFFLLFEAVLRAFGRTEMVGRSFAILGALLGFTLVVVSLGRRDPLVYAALPLILLSGSGRDSIPFVFIEVAQYAWIGILLWITARWGDSPRYDSIFRIALVLALFFNQLVLPFAAAIVVLRWVERRSARNLLIDLAVLGAGGAAVLLALAAGAGDLGAGRQELVRIFRYRSSEPLAAWAVALAGELGDSLHLGPAGPYLVAAAWLVSLKARQWRTAALLPSYLLFALLLREYVTMHHFARLLWAFFSLVTLAAAVESGIVWLVPPRWWNPARIAVGVLLAVLAGTARPQYEPNRGMQIARNALLEITTDPRQAARLERCNAFRFSPDFQEEHFDPLGRMGQFFFGMQVVERVRRDAPVQTCVIDLQSYTVRGP